MIGLAIAVVAILFFAAVVVAQHTEGLLGQRTRIMRTVGTTNASDEGSGMPGVITSMPLLSYSHTYFDGTGLSSCDECPNATLCPDCPQYRETGVLHGSALHGSMITSGATESFEATPAGQDHPTADDAQYTDFGVYYDVAPDGPAEISNSRSMPRMGGHILRPATASDDWFDSTSWTHGSTIPIYTGRVGSSPAMKLLYGSAMSLPETVPPATEPHTYLGYNGYVYKN